jgi:hypothetical protein
VNREREEEEGASGIDQLASRGEWRERRIEAESEIDQVASRGE